MSARFRCSDPLAGDFEFEDVEALLDGLEAALVSPDTPLFDAVRQSWQPVATHAEVRAAWDARLRYRPPNSVGLTLPELPPERAVVEEELARRREAFAVVRAGRAAIPAGHADQSAGRPRIAIAGTVWVLLLLLLLAWGLIAFAERLANLAARAAGLDGPSSP
jgi:hypothetical protein